MRPKWQNRSWRHPEELLPPQNPLCNRAHRQLSLSSEETGPSPPFLPLRLKKKEKRKKITETKRTERFGIRTFDGIVTVRSDCAFLFLTTYFHIYHSSLGYPNSSPKPPSPFPAQGRHKEAGHLAFRSFPCPSGKNLAPSSSTEQDLAVSDAQEHRSDQFTLIQRSHVCFATTSTLRGFLFFVDEAHPISQTPHLQPGSIKKGEVWSLNSTGSKPRTLLRLPKPWAPPGSPLSISQN